MSLFSVQRTIIIITTTAASSSSSSSLSSSSSYRSKGNHPRAHKSIVNKNTVSNSKFCVNNCKSNTTMMMRNGRLIRSSFQLCSTTDGRNRLHLSGSFCDVSNNSNNSRSVFISALLNNSNQQQQQQQQQQAKPVQMPPRLTNTINKKQSSIPVENLPPFQSQVGNERGGVNTASRGGGGGAFQQRQQQSMMMNNEQKFRSIPPQPLQTHGNNESDLLKPVSRFEGKLLPDDVDAAYHQMQHLGSKWADLHAEAEILEEAKKCILATITLYHVDNGDAKTTAEVRAHASKEYQDHIKKMVEARRLANQAKIELESVKTHLNLVRTFESSRREELKML
jgi:hypothetical protein